MRESWFFQNWGTFNTNQNKKYHNFERIEIRATVFLKWTDFRSSTDCIEQNPRKLWSLMFHWLFRLNGKGQINWIIEKYMLCTTYYWLTMRRKHFWNHICIFYKKIYIHTYVLFQTLAVTKSRIITIFQFERKVGFWTTLKFTSKEIKSIIKNRSSLEE